VLVLFISDLHLDASRPSATDAFHRFLRQDARKADRLYILGDLFEYWVSDGDQNPHHRGVIAALAELTASGVSCYIMHGNRDFMLGKQFEQDTGATLLYDPTLIYAGGKSVLISHGDALCTDDIAYQRFRKIVRIHWLQQIYHSLPFALQSRIFAKTRRASMNKLSDKPPEILDVNPQAVIDSLKRYEVDTLLHGHTHRPAIHHFEIDGRAMTRIVLGDWYESGSVLSWDDAGPRLSSLDF